MLRPFHRRADFLVGAGAVVYTYGAFCAWLAVFILAQPLHLWSFGGFALTFGPALVPLGVFDGQYAIPVCLATGLGLIAWGLRDRPEFWECVRP
jgi:hypothetical protein